MTIDFASRRGPRPPGSHAGLEGDAGRHRARDPDGGSHGPGASVRRRRAVHDDLRRRRLRRRPRRVCSSSTAHGGRFATITAVRPPARFGHSRSSRARVRGFSEKPQLGEGWINGGFFVLEPGVFDYIDGDDDWAQEPLEGLGRDGQLMALPPRRLLAVHGHAARQGAAEAAVELRRGAVEGLGLKPTRRERIDQLC